MRQYLLNNGCAFVMQDVPTQQLLSCHWRLQHAARSLIFTALQLSPTALGCQVLIKQPQPAAWINW